MKSSAIALLLLLTGSAAPNGSSNCRIEGTAAAEAADATRARAACETARARFAELFGEPVPAVRVVLRERSGYRIGVQDDRAVIFWPTGQVMTAGVGDAATGERHLQEQWRNVLPHEIAHALLAARFPAEEHGEAGAGYGSGLPDWLDEGVAIWAESPENRRGRLAQARSLPEPRRELRSILTAQHPAAGNAAMLAIRDGAPIPRDEALRTFYPQAIAVLAFIYEAGGQNAIRELVRRLVARRDAPGAVAGLPGLPDDFGGVVAAWQDWLSSAGAAAADPMDAAVSGKR